MGHDDETPGLGHLLPASQSSLLDVLAACANIGPDNCKQGWTESMWGALLHLAACAREGSCGGEPVSATTEDFVHVGSLAALKGFAHAMERRQPHRDVPTDEVIGGMLLVRAILCRSLLANYRCDYRLVSRILDVYEPYLGHDSHASARRKAISETT